jgi:hypothetical protein
MGEALPMGYVRFVVLVGLTSDAWPVWESICSLVLNHARRQKM